MTCFFFIDVKIHYPPCVVIILENQLSVEMQVVAGVIGVLYDMCVQVER